MNTSIYFGPDKYDAMGIAYEKAYGNDPDLIRILRSWLSHLPPTARILDCGPGTGKPVARTIADSGRHVHGIDWSMTMINLSQKAVPEGTFELVNMLQYEPEEPFDGIVCSLSLFERKRNELELMAKHWFNWLKPGGSLLINTFPAEDCPAARGYFDADGLWARDVRWLFLGEMLIIGLFTREGWKKLLDGAGLEIVRTEETRFQPEAECYEEPRYYITARKPEKVGRF